MKLLLVSVSAILCLTLGCPGREASSVEQLLVPSGSLQPAREAISSLEEAPLGDPLGLDPRTWSIGGHPIRSAGVDGSIALTSTEGPPTLTLATQLAADDIDRIEVDIRGVHAPGRPRLTWRRAGEAECEGCWLQLMWRDGFGESRSRFAFEVGAHPLWSGHIVDLTLRPSDLRSVDVRVGPFSFLRRRIDPRISSGEIAPPVALVTSAHEARIARFLPPGQPFRAPAQLRTGSRLHFALTRESGARGTATFEVGATRAGTRHVVASEELPPFPGWAERQVDLSHLAGDSVILDFAIRSSESSYDIDEAVYLGGPRIVAARGKDPRPNVVLISIDTLRADRLSLYGNPRATSPQLEALAARGAVVFEQTIAAASSTLPAHASLFTGLEVLNHGAYLDRPVPPSQVLLAERFQGAGYETLAVTGGGYVHPRYGLARGFDRFRFWPRGEVENSAELADGFATAGRWLQQPRPQPFFLFLHTYEVHAPYRSRPRCSPQCPDPYAGWLIQPWARGESPDDGYLTRSRWPRVFGDGPARDMRAEELQQMIDFYDSGVARVDAAVGEFIREIDSAGLAGNTVIVITSDHGEALGEGQRFDHGYLYDSNLLVPLLIFDPRNPAAGRRVRRQVQQIDILPTLLELAGLPSASGIDGTSLVPAIQGKPRHGRAEAWSYAAETNHGISVRTERFKFIVPDTIFSTRGRFDWEVYRVDHDSNELSALAEGEAPSVERVAVAVREHLGSGRSSIALEWSNTSDTPVSGFLESNALNQRNLKGTGTDDARFWMAGPGLLKFTIPPKVRSRVRVQTLTPTIDYRLLQFDKQPVAAGALTMATLCQAPTQLFGDQPGGPDLWTGFTLVASANLGPCDDTPSPAVDPELEAQLRALGYIQ